MKYTNIDTAYGNVLCDILENGTPHTNRTGEETRRIIGATVRYDLSKGAPFLLGKKVHPRSVIVELCGFLSGKTQKSWYAERGCKIWNEWCNPQKVPYGKDPETLALMAAEDDLGPIGYAAGMRRFGEFALGEQEGHGHAAEIGGFDQWRWLIETAIPKVIATDGEASEARRMIISYWNPLEQPFMALPPCHYSFQVLIQGGKLHLIFNIRSNDMFLGAPFNLASYGTLAAMLAWKFKLQPGQLISNIGDAHIYMNHMEQVAEYLKRIGTPGSLPQNLARLEFDDALDLLNPNPDLIRLVDYNPLPAIKAPIAV